MEFPEDITLEILKRLPVKTLMRFKCVSKWWRSLISSNSFVKTHLGRIRSEAHLGIVSSIILSRYGDSLLSMDPQNAGPQQAMELDFPTRPYFPYYVKGHCDGLICCVLDDGPRSLLLLYNASLRKYRRMPLPPNFRSTREVIGLGFDGSAEAYKIVRIPSTDYGLNVPGYVPTAYVFSSKSNLWRKLPDEDTLPYFVEHVLQATAANGGLYWIAEDKDSLVCVILRFDLASDKFRVVPSPPDELNRRISWIGSLKDQLCALYSQSVEHVDVWGTKDDQTWTKLITVPRSQSYGLRYTSQPYTPLCFTKSGALLISVERERFVTYDPVEKTFRQVEIRGAEHYLQETAYVESLVSPYFGNEEARAVANLPTSVYRDKYEDQSSSSSNVRRRSRSGNPVRRTKDEDQSSSSFRVAKPLSAAPNRPVCPGNASRGGAQQRKRKRTRSKIGSVC